MELMGVNRALKGLVEAVGIHVTDSASMTRSRMSLKTLFRLSMSPMRQWLSAGDDFQENAVSVHVVAEVLGVDSVPGSTRMLSGKPYGRNQLLRKISRADQ